jgi:tRNA-dihydrouridine synthase B
VKFPALDGRFLLAPMSGVSDVAFRVLCRQHGAAMTYTEFCSADGVVRQNFTTKKQYFVAPKEDPVGVQLFGKDKDTLKTAAKVVAHRASVIDLNLGCPAHNVFSQGFGSALLRDPLQIEELVSEMKRAVDKPLTVKLRLGLDSSSINFLEVASRCVDAGAAAVTLHARTAKQGYSGRADWNAIKELKEVLSVPVIGNGDVFLAKDAVDMLSLTNCDFVMIGRGAQRNPFLFSQANQLLAEGYCREPSEEERLSLFFEYCQLALVFGIDFLRVKTHAVSLTRGFSSAKRLRERIVASKNKEELLEVFS